MGFLKRSYLGQALGPSGLRLNAGIKRALDPQGILNPGKAAT